MSNSSSNCNFNPQNPNSFGPPLWDFFHTTSVHCDNHKGSDFHLNFFITTLWVQISNIRCETCNRDATTYLHSNDVRQFLKANSHLSHPLSEYMRTFHNWVSKKVKRENFVEFTWHEYELKYIKEKPQICKGGCGH